MTFLCTCVPSICEGERGEGVHDMDYCISHWDMREVSS